LGDEFAIEEVKQQTLGLDGIPGEFWKVFWRQKKTVNLLTTFLNKIKEEGTVPSEWNIAIVWAVYKRNGSVHDI
jgi:hypothetical protein